MAGTRYQSLPVFNFHKVLAHLWTLIPCYILHIECFALSINPKNVIIGSLWVTRHQRIESLTIGWWHLFITFYPLQTLHRHSFKFRPVVVSRYQYWELSHPYVVQVHIDRSSSTCNRKLASYIQSIISCNKMHFYKLGNSHSRKST